MKWELHMHTAESSGCGHVSAADGVAAYARMGYDGVVIADHYNEYTLNWLGGSPEERIRKWMRGYEAAKEAGERLGVQVLFGLEARVPGSDNDYLVLGAEPEFVRKNPGMCDGTLSELHEICKRNHVLLVQAHPYRVGYCEPAPVEDVDGYEVFNGNPRHRNENEKAMLRAETYPEMIRTSGSDFHQMEDLARGGIETERDIRTSAELAQMLRDGAYRLITPR